MAPAKEPVISIPELLEHTLAHLPMRDLLVVAPLVSKTWQTTTRSPTLQRVLFFEADPALTGTEPVLNPLLAELFPPFFALERDVDDGKDRPWTWPSDANAMKAMPWTKAPDAFKRAGASWRRMLVTQPPVQKIVIIQTTRHIPGGTSERRAVLPELSLRMGLLYDLVVPFLHDGETFSMRWNNGLDRDTDLSLKLYSMTS